MKWKASTENPPGKIQVNRFNAALGKLRMEHNTYRHLWGTIGGEEHESCMCSIFGANVRDDVAAVQNSVGEKYGWTITKDNAKSATEDLLAALPELADNRPVKDERKTTEQVAVDRAEMARAETEREENRLVFEAQVAEECAKLRAEYPWANQDVSLPARVRASGNLKEELSRAFPGIKFSVRSEGYSGGNHVSVSWELGPKTEEVRNISRKYQGGHFDGMTDSYEYDNSVRGEAVSRVLGVAKYVQDSRRVEVSDELREAMARQLCELHEVQWNGLNTLLDYGMHGVEVGDAVYSVLHGTSFPAGAVVTGVERIPDVESGVNDPATFYRATFTVEAPVEGTEAAEAATGDGVEVRYNKQHDGVEIRFNAKPDPNVLSKLKAHGFRWSKFSKVWYKRYSPTAWQTACAIAGVNVAPPAPAAGPDRFDMAVEDQMAAACGL